MSALTIKQFNFRSKSLEGIRGVRRGFFRALGLNTKHFERFYLLFNKQHHVYFNFSSRSTERNKRNKIGAHFGS